MYYTNEQRYAIDTTGKSILVSASAGSGKTTVMIERIASLVARDRVPLKNILVLTYTNLAASEMRQRLFNLLEAMSGDEFVFEQISNFSAANIGTIHSLCSDVLRGNFTALNLDPNFIIADEAEAEVLKHRAIDKTLEKYYEQSSPEFFELVDILGKKRRDESLQKIILDIYKYAINCVDPIDWLRRAGCFHAEETAAKCQDIISRRYASAAAFYDGLLQPLILKCRKLEIKGYYEPLERLSEDLARINVENTFEINYNNIRAVDIKRFMPVPKNLKSDATDVAVSEAKALKKEIKKDTERLSGVFNNFAPDELIKQLKMTLPYTELLSKITEDFLNEYERLKSKRCTLDFNDLEHKTNAVLNDKELREDLRQRYRHVFVDEYQDTNELQESILNKLGGGCAGDGNMFMVGDIKQSIYAFRLCEPKIFREKFKAYKADGEENFALSLNHNFRSRDKIIDFVNLIFDRIMTDGFGGADYKNTARLLTSGDKSMAEAVAAVVGGAPNALDEVAAPEADAMGGAVSKSAATGREPCIFVDLIKTREELSDDNPQGEDDRSEAPFTDSANEANAVSAAPNDASSDAQAAPPKKIYSVMDGETVAEKFSDAEAEGQSIALRITKLLTKIITENGITRKVEYRDIAILTRSQTNYSRIIFETLKKAGLPVVFGVGGAGSADADGGGIIKVFLSYLYLLDNRFLDIALIASMKSFLYDFSDDELSDIKITYDEAAGKNSDGCDGTNGGNKDANAGGCFFDCVKYYAKNKSGALSLKLTAFLSDIDRYAFSAQSLDVVGLLNKIIMEKDVMIKLLSQRDGEKKACVLNNFLIGFKNKGIAARLSSFCEFAAENEIRVSGGAVAQANSIKMLSIHAGKGLEYPVVILAGLSSRADKKDGGDVAINKELGFALSFYDTQRRKSNNTLAKFAIKLQNSYAAAEEELRILYVALTRARHYLCLSGSFSGEKYNFDISPYFLSSKPYFMQWIGAVLFNEKDPVAGGGLYELNIVSKDKLKEYATGKDGGNAVGGKIATAGAAEAGHGGIGGGSRRDTEATIGAAVHRLIFKNRDAEALERVNKTLNFSYPYKAATALDFKKAVSAIKIKSRDYGDGETPKIRLSGIQDGNIEDNREIGIIYHKILQNIDYGKSDPAEISAAIEGLFKARVIDGGFRDKIDPAIIQNALSCDIVRRALKNKYYKEQPFMYILPAREIDKNQAEGDGVIVQGIIDLLIVEDDKIIIADFKYSDTTDAERLKQKYRTQLNLYADACERVLNYRVSEKLLYNLKSGQIINMG
jgi:ATP-dependent helicase/nuclease subunit A